MNCNYICPMLTSVKEDGSVDYDHMHAFYDRLIAAGMDGVLVGGSAGEFYAFNLEDTRAMIEDAVRYIKGRMKVIGGTGRMNQEETVALSNAVLAAGADAVMVVGPYYCGCRQKDVLAYYDAVMGAIEGPVYLYNFPDRTGYDVSCDTLKTLLAHHKNFVGIKDTHPVLRHTQKIINEVKSLYPDFAVYTGYDNNCFGVVMSGGDGCIGALSNIYPKVCAKIIAALRNEDLPEIIHWQRFIDGKFKFYEQEIPFNMIMKWALADLGYPMHERGKDPLQALTEEEKVAMEALANELWKQEKEC